jgi:hypothetical protein
MRSLLGKGDPDMPEDPVELQRSSERASAMIQRIEQAVRDVRSAVIGAAPGAIPPHILSPIHRIARNEGNPLRNKYALRAAVLERQLTKYPIPGNAFFYMLAGEGRSGSAATFRETDRTFFGREEDFAQGSLLDGIIACHEAVHITQDDAARASISTIADARRYHERLAFLSEGNRVVINAELPAYAREFQIANLVLRGALQDPSRVTEEDVAERLGAKRPDQQIVVGTLLRLARAFPGFWLQEQDQPYPPSFAAELISLYRSNRFEIYAQTPNGSLQHI